MRTRLIAFRAARTVGAAALLMVPAAGSAYADGSVTATVSPAGAGPGDRVEIRVRGCQSSGGTARSQAFSGPAELRGEGSHDPRNSSHDAQQSQSGAESVRSGEQSSSERENAPTDEGGARYDSGQVVSESQRERSSVLKGHTLHGYATIEDRLAPGSHQITVRCAGREHRAAGTVHIAGPHSRPVHPSPVAPVRAGGGGTAVLAAEQRPPNDTDGAGPGTPHTVIGLVLAGVAAVVVAVRGSRRRRQGSD